MKPRIYLAGPDVFRPNAKEHAEALKAVCAEHGLEGVFPLDNEVDILREDAAQVIFEANVEMIRGCQGVLANMTPFRGPSTDVGTGWEMGFAYALGLPVVGYTTDPRPYTAKVKEYRSYTGAFHAVWADREGPGYHGFDDPEMVEDFDLLDNLMLNCCTWGILGAGPVPLVGIWPPRDPGPFEMAAARMAAILKVVGTSG